MSEKPANSAISADLNYAALPMEAIRQVTQHGALDVRLRSVDDAVQAMTQEVSYEYNPEFMRLLLQYAAINIGEADITQLYVFRQFGITVFEAQTMARTIHQIARALSVCAFHHGGDAPLDAPIVAWSDEDELDDSDAFNTGPR